MSVTMSAELKNLKRKLGGVTRAVTTGCKRALVTAVTAAEYEVVRKNFTGYAGGRGRLQKLQNRSGLLRRSVNHKVTGSRISDLVAKFGASAPYAKAHEYGRPATMSKRGKKFYPIPTRNALTGAGVLRKPITAYVDHSTVTRKRGGGLGRGRTRRYGFVRIAGKLLFVEHKARGKFTVLFTLHRFPTSPIPPRLGIRAAGKKQLPNIRKGILEALREAIK